MAVLLFDCSVLQEVSLSDKILLNHIKFTHLQEAALTIKLYGIKNCDTIKKARNWLEQHDISYQFIDHRVDGINVAELHLWLDKLGWEPLVNKRSTTYRTLSDADKANLGAETAAALLEANPTLIKRPLLEQDGEFYVGFNDVLYSRLFRLASNKD